MYELKIYFNFCQTESDNVAAWTDISKLEQSMSLCDSKLKEQVYVCEKYDIYIFFRFSQCDIDRSIFFSCNIRARNRPDNISNVSNVDSWFKYDNDINQRETYHVNKISEN